MLNATLYTEFTWNLPKIDLNSVSESVTLPDSLGFRSARNADQLQADNPTMKAELILEVLLLADCAHCRWMNTGELWALEMFQALSRVAFQLEEDSSLAI